MSIDSLNSKSLDQLVWRYQSQYLQQPDSDGVFDSHRQIVEWLEERGSRHRNYRYYSSRSRIENILSESAIYCTDGSSWNDLRDREAFNPPGSQEKRFGLCLSFSSTESVAMWMLYSGSDRDGAMIDFDKRALLVLRKLTVSKLAFLAEADLSVSAK